MRRFDHKEQGESRFPIRAGMVDRDDSKGVVVQFPRASDGGATFFRIWECRAWMLLARIANRFGLPGFIGPVVIDDSVTSRHIEIRMGLLFTVLSVRCPGLLLPSVVWRL